MKKKQVKHIWYNFRVSGDTPMDDKSRIESLSTLDAELPLNERVNGLIFYVVDIAEHYFFSGDLQTPLPLKEAILATDIKGISVANYATLITALDNANKTLGAKVTVFPLRVTFMYDGAKWGYDSGTYVVDSQAKALTIPTSLREPGKIVLIGTTRYVWNADGSLSQEAETVGEIPSNPESNKYYVIDDILYYSISGKLYKISAKQQVLENVTMSVGDNTITHTLKSVYIDCKGYLNINGKNQVLDLKLEVVNENSIKIKSSLALTGVTLIILSNF